MAYKIYVSATDQNAGKTTISIALLHLARNAGMRIAFIKPVGPKPVDYDGGKIDKDALTVAQVFALEAQLELMCPVVVTRGMTQRALRGEIPVAALEEAILAAVRQLEAQCDLLVIEGAGHSGVGAVLGLSNARVAALLDAPVLMITGGGIGSVVDAVTLNLALYRECGATVRMLVANKLHIRHRETSLEYLRLAFAMANFTVVGGFDYLPTLANPTLKRVARLLDSEVYGDQSALERIIHHVDLGAGSTQRMVDQIKENTLLLVTNSRNELIVTLANLYQHRPEYRERLVGLIISGITSVSGIAPITQLILAESGLPYLREEKQMSELFLTLHDFVSKLSGEDAEKIALIRTLAPKRFELQAILAQMAHS
jgi:hypothetical protein